MRPTLARLLAVTLGGAACSSSHDAVTAPSGPSLSGSPCSSSGTVQLSSAGAVRVDCANGGTTVTLAGNGASYLVVPQFAVSLVPNTSVSYRLRSGSAIAAAIAPSSQFSSTAGLEGSLAATGLPVVPSRARQLALDGALRARARAKVASGSWRAAALGAAASRVAITAQVAPTPPPIGSVRPFRV
ncbi:MAG TPA: hypothetical protein VGP84_24065, partial [Gemmatimonadaceae bacterium]|nr:hypothetical protein [Gemmatimonadaceae bacterium]